MCVLGKSRVVQEGVYVTIDSSFWPHDRIDVTIRETLNRSDEFRVFLSKIPNGPHPYNSVNFENVLSFLKEASYLARFVCSVDACKHAMENVGLFFHRTCSRFCFSKIVHGAIACHRRRRRWRRGLEAKQLKVGFPDETRLHSIITQTLSKLLSIWDVDRCTCNVCAFLQLIVEYAHDSDCKLFPPMFGIVRDCAISKLVEQTVIHTSLLLVD